MFIIIRHASNSRIQLNNIKNICLFYYAISIKNQIKQILKIENEEKL